MRQCGRILGCWGHRIDELAGTGLLMIWYLEFSLPSCPTHDRVFFTQKHPVQRRFRFRWWKAYIIIHANTNTIGSSNTLQTLRAHTTCVVDVIPNFDEQSQPTRQASRRAGTPTRCVLFEQPPAWFVDFLPNFLVSPNARTSSDRAFLHIASKDARDRLS